MTCAYPQFYEIVHGWPEARQKLEQEMRSYTNYLN